MTLAAIGPGTDSEAGALFNPAFCSLLLNKACAGFEAKSRNELPVTLAFLILPSALHKPTRDALPSTTGASMWGWLRGHPLLLMDLPSRAKDFQRFTASAITFGLHHGVLLGSAGALKAGTLRRRPRSLNSTQDWEDCVRTAAFLGKWFGATNADEATTLAQWGVRP